MSFVLKNGLFRLNVTDHHAILGVSLDADAKEIRLKYLKIVQTLHPDRCKSDVIRKELASEILSKLVNPAYEHLSRKQSFAEHQLVLTQIGKHLTEKKEQLNVTSEAAQELLKAGDRVELVYPNLLKNLAEQEYQYLEKVTDNIEAISELHLVYLALKQGKGINREERVETSAKPKEQPAVQPTDAVTPQSKPETTVQSNPAAASSNAVNNKEQDEEAAIKERIAAYIRRASDYIAHGSYTQAIAELKYALKLDPHHATSHALMGKAYLEQRQITMAKVHINKAFDANDRDPMIIELKKQLDKLDPNRSKQETAKSTKPANDKSAAKSTNSGIFGGLFGPKKK
jgi:tetratricopeptide (TPR) repeat protein